MKTIKEFIDYYYSYSKSKLCQKYPGLSSVRLLEEYCDFYSLSANDVWMGFREEFIYSLERGVPLEYLQDNAFFYRSNFYVNKNVLIPRSETEILVEDAVGYIRKNYKKDFSIAEVGAGSFIIGLTLAMEVDEKLNIWAGDLCEKALEVSKINSFKLKLKMNPETQIELQKSDRLEATLGRYNFIISNPPYIRRKIDLDGVHEQTHIYEPHIALYLDDHIFEKWFEDFFRDARSKLAEGGAFFMEGHEDSLLQLQQIALKYFTKVDIKKDYNQRNRFLYAYL